MNNEITAARLAAQALEAAERASDKRCSIPVIFLDSEGRPTQDYISGSPCINIQVWAQAKTVTCWACLDTGADYCYATPEIIAEAQLPQYAQVSANAEMTGLYNGYILPVGASLMVSASIASRQIRLHGNGFDVLLGRSFLKFGQLTFGGDGSSKCEFAFG